jgi:hypothetical protein
MFKFEFWGVVGVIAVQAFCVWWIMRLGSEVLRIYFSQMH